VDALRLLHFGLVCAWGGVLLVEFIVESLGADDSSLAAAARLHFWIDALAEMPIVIGVLITGAWLTWRAWPPTDLLLIKIASALIAVMINLYCCAVVIARYRCRANAGAVRRYRRHVRASALGVPFGAAAAYIGLAYFH
jgi:hypothetical protein